VSLTLTGVTLASLPTGRLHDALAKAGPGPAGGSAAALATMMSSGLVRLVARVSHDWEEAPGIAAQAAALGDRSLALADEDHVAYARALEQLRSPDRDAALGKALHRAAEVPLLIAETAADVASLAALAARDGDDAVRGDAWAAATLAEAASTAAARLVHVNLATRPDDELSLRADVAARAAAAARDVALRTT
jgi:formiminotetrahydrofolate cyclodeaminase